MQNSTSWARIAALTASLAVVTAGVPASSVFAQEEAPPVSLEQARSGEDGTSGSGANVGNASTGNAERDRHGNGGNASVASAGEGGETEATDPEAAPLPENAELLAALGILGVVTDYNLTVLDGSDIPISLLPPPADAAPVTSDVDTGGVGASDVTTGDATIEEVTTGETSTISMEPGSGSAPATGSTGTAAEDGIGATESGERDRERPRNSDDVSVDEAPGG